jgi:hypothetical protein
MPSQKSGDSTRMHVCLQALFSTDKAAAWACQSLATTLGTGAKRFPPNSPQFAFQIVLFPLSGVQTVGAIYSLKWGSESPENGCLGG